MQLLNNNSPVVNHQYTYDVQNRLASVGNGTHAAHYTRLDGSGLLSNTAIKTSGGTTLLSTDRAYDAYYRMTSIASTAGATTRSYAYTYNDKDQRTICTLADGSYWEYAYDDKGQVTGGIKYDAGGIAIPGMSFGYDYDGIGNRKQETRGIEELKLLYASNRVNQYTQITTPGVVPVAGEADADTIVKALRNDAGSPSSGEQAVIARRDGKYFTAAFTKVDNAASAKEIPYTVYAIRDDATANKQYIQKKSSSYTVPKREQTPTYDADGNMLTMPQGAEMWTLTWTGENRLATATSSDELTKLEFVYDYMGRRVSKQVYTGSVGNWTLASESKYVYDGYYQIAEFDGSDNMLKSYLRAGGEVYAVTDTNQSVTYFYMTDGNKNIMALVDASGNVQADYTYDPFGRIVSKSGAYADANAFRFSSEFHDTETNLVYYNYRYYSPDLGRWTKRDPIEEQGGYNLYGMVGNNPISYFDILGMWRRVSSSGHVWCAEPGDNLKDLAKEKEYGGDEKNWSCLWPVEAVNSGKYQSGFVNSGETYDAGSLVENGSNFPALRIIADKGLREGWTGMTDWGTLTPMNGNRILGEILRVSGQGATPIKELFIVGHNGTGGDGGYFKVDDLLKYDMPPSFERAKKRKGPARCWFSRKSKAIFAGCSSQKTAEPFAKHFLRKSATAWGTNQEVGFKDNNIFFEGKYYPNRTHDWLSKGSWWGEGAHMLVWQKNKGGL